MKRYLTLMQGINKAMDFIAGSTLILIMLLTSFDVVLRYLGYPIQGSYDMVTLAAAFVIGFALPRTTWDRTHINVDILIVKLPIRQQFFFNLITRLLSVALFVIIGWNLTKMGASFLKTGDSTLTLGLPLYPIAFALGFAAFIECLALVADMVKLFAKGEEYE